MEKRNTLGLLLAGALAGGAIYFLFFTERGRKLLDRLTDMASEKLDEWLAEVEDELEKAEKEAAGDVTVEH
jgi:DNA-binding MarR family transcriptional regulator